MDVLRKHRWTLHLRTTQRLPRIGLDRLHPERRFSPAVPAMVAETQHADGKRGMGGKESSKASALDLHASSVVPGMSDKPGTKTEATKVMPHEAVTEIDDKDKGTPDEWITRHPDLIRLTGRHPFNAELPPEKLMDRGFITPASLHYVRNHGRVPKLSWAEHRLTVTGLVERPRTFTMDELAEMPQVTVLCTLTCSGNRRKEVNMVERSKGYNWGPAATGCSYWNGVRMSHLLRLCGVRDGDGEERHVRFRGPKGELSKGKDGSYGTSLPLWKCMWDGSDVIIAWKQNGQTLLPDHGFPIRMIIPGHIGGRQVKWLEEIEVADSESTNYYHHYDNKMLPSHVNEDLAKEDASLWHNPDYICNELNINSIITNPAHDEAVPYAETTLVRGYAYAGGQKIIRCELSLDDGKSWKLADIRRVQPKPNSGGKFWAWVHWDIAVPTEELLQTREMRCRAWTHEMNTQPDHLTWNLLGDMNNSVYRVKVLPIVEGGRLALRYEHPVVLGSAVGGWMNREDEQPAEEEEAPPPDSNARRIPMSEVEKHDNKDSAWFVRDGKVYDATPFLSEHPGGADAIQSSSGQDASDEFNSIHPASAKKMLQKYYIGELDDSAQEGSDDSSQTAEAGGEAEDGGEAVALNPKKKQGFKLAEKQELSHNARRFRFELQSPDTRLGLPVGKHIYVYGKVDGETVMRPYTPVSLDDERGYFDLVIKIYWANEDPKHPEGGKLSQWLEAQPIGTVVDVKGPTGHFEYLGRGRYQMGERQGTATHMSMCAGGTGITPCFQVIKAILKDPEDKTQVSLIYANKTPDDILLWEELDQMAAEHENFKVWYTVSHFSESDDPEKQEGDWKYDVGHITQEMADKHLFKPGPDSLALFCGPPPMIEKACKPFAQAMGYSEDDMVFF